MLSDRGRYRSGPYEEVPTATGGSIPVAGQRGLGDRCEDDTRCQSGLCLDITDDGLPAFCSTYCYAGVCPAGMSCRAVVSGGSVCGFDGPPAGGEVGAACRFDLECVSGLCIDIALDERGKFCSRDCSERACPLDMVCASLDDGGAVCVLPPPEGQGAVGQACRSAIDCRSGDCIDVVGDPYGPFCTAPCRSDGDCPDSMGCFAGSDGARRCLHRTGSAVVGAFCRNDADCAAGLCIDVYGDMAGAYCTDTCRGDVDCPSSMRCADLAGLGPTCIY
jgi:hypothetical protein